MRAAIQDRRIEAIAGPLHVDLTNPTLVPTGYPQEITLPTTPDVPVSVIFAYTTPENLDDDAGGYFFNSPLDAEGRRAYAWMSSTVRVGFGLPAHNVSLAPGTSVMSGTWGRGIPAHTRLAGSRPVTGVVHRLLVWPRLLTEKENFAAQLWLAQSLGISA